MSKASDAGAVGELFTLTGTTNTAPTGGVSARIWMYPCVLCNTLTVVEPGELCADCGNSTTAPAPARRRRAVKQAPGRTARKTRTKKTAARRGGES